MAKKVKRKKFDGRAWGVIDNDGYCTPELYDSRTVARSMVRFWNEASAPRTFRVIRVRITEVR